MSRKSLCLVAFVLLAAYGASPVKAAAKAFSVKAFIDQHVCNDTQVGPNQNEQQIGVHVRDIDTRRRVGLFSFDISALKAPGVVFKNVSLSNLGASAGPINVYGVIESQDNLLPETELTWNNAPGVKNDPAPVVNTAVVLDRADLTPLLMTFTSPANNVRASTAPSQALADFINRDTDGIITLLFAPNAGSSAIFRAKENPDPPGGTYLEGILATQVELPLDPNPADTSVDVYRDVALSWTPGQSAAAHDVYFGTVLNDVSTASRTNPLGVLVAQGQQASTFDPGPLEFGQTYYWRIDEVNAPPDSTVFQGPVWSFTVEPLTYRVEKIAATASSFEPPQEPNNTINGSGLDEAGLHSADSGAMWLSALEGPTPVWIQYDFDRVYKLQQMQVWNYNGEFEDIIGYGVKNVTVSYSSNGADWAVLGSFDVEQGTGLDGSAAGKTVDFGGLAAKSVKITVNEDWGGMGQSGLSEVRFLYIPAQARNPQPASGQTGVALDAVLSWRPGREAASHQVYFSADQKAVAEGTAPVVTTVENSYMPDVLGLATAYYWRVDEVNQAQSPSVWAGDVWSFTTTDYVVVDDFESYTDNEAAGTTIYQAWVDGYGANSTTNGSRVGNLQSPFAEQTIVHSGAQSMPLSFSDTSSFAYSEAMRTFGTAQNWTQSGISTLVLYFYGNANNKTSEPIWVKLTDQSNKTGRIIYGAAAGENVANLAAASWHEWQIPLSGLGVNLAKVKAISLGFGTPGGASSGNTGVVYIDDIRLTKAAPAR